MIAVCWVIATRQVIDSQPLPSHGGICARMLTTLLHKVAIRRSTETGGVVAFSELLK